MSIVTTPRPENLPFVDSRFRLAKNSERDKNIDYKFWPGAFGEVPIKVLSRLTNESLECLLSLIRPTISGHVLLTHAHLDKITSESGEIFRKYFVIDGGRDDFTDQQLTSYLLTLAQYEKKVDWRKIARLYNTSSSDQRAALYDFFWEFHQVALNNLLSAAEPMLNAPETLLSFKTKEADGETFVHCDIANDWVRDDRFHRQFKITASKSQYSDAQVIAYAGTLELAIAKATLFTQGESGVILDSQGKPKLLTESILKKASSVVCIYFEDDNSSRVVAIASLKRNLKILPDTITAQDCKLEWGPCEKFGPFKEKGFRHALYTAEKLLGVQWSKTQHLEDALGL